MGIFSEKKLYNRLALPLFVKGDLPEIKEKYLESLLISQNNSLVQIYYFSNNNKPKIEHLVAMLYVKNDLHLSNKLVED